MRILIITDCLPYPPFSGDRLRIYNLLRRIAARHEVCLAALSDAPDKEEESLSHLRKLCQMVETAPVQRRHPIAHLPGLVRYMLANKPLELKFQHSARMVQRIREITTDQNFDIIQIEHSHMALYLEALSPCSQSKRLLVFHDVTSQQYARLSGIEQRAVIQIRYWLYSRMMRDWESRYASHFDHCVAVSERDRQLLLEANPHLHIDVVPNGVDTKKLQLLPGATNPISLLFVGKMSYPACADGALYLCNEVLPLIRREIPGIDTWLVGADPNPEVQGLAGDNVHVTGRVDDVVPYYRHCGISVVPIRAGSGTRLKILEALALGRPVVSTSIGCEGLPVVDGEHLLVGNSPGELAAQVVRLLRDESLSRYLISNARRLVETHYDWDLVADQQMQIYAKMVE